MPPDISRRLIGGIKTTGNGVQKLAHQYGWGDNAILPNVPSYIADIETSAGREQRFEKQVAGIIASRAVATAESLCHEVKTECTRTPGKGIVVHPDEADHLERDTAHRYQGAAGDAAGEKSSWPPRH